MSEATASDGGRVGSDGSGGRVGSDGSGGRAESDDHGDSGGRPPRRLVRIDLRAVTRTSWGIVVLVLTLAVLYTVVVNGYVFPSEAIRSGIFRPIAVTTAGLVQPTLLVNLLSLLGMLLVFRVVGLDWADVGLERGRIGRAIAVLVLVLAGIEVVGAATQLSTTGRIAVAGTWTASATGSVVGAFLAQALGNALYEEVVYRGFLLTQVALLLDRHLADWRVRLGAALLGTQAVFALIHVPNRLYQGYALAAIPSSLGFVFVSGVLFALVYYRTGNLFVAVGLHALGNAPLSVFAAGEFASWLAHAAMAVLILAWRPIDGLLSGVAKRVP